MHDEMAESDRRTCRFSVLRGVFWWFDLRAWLRNTRYDDDSASQTVGIV